MDWLLYDIIFDSFSAKINDEHELMKFTGLTMSETARFIQGGKGLLKMESQCQVITTPCETGCFPTQNCIELRHSIYNKGGTISHLLGDMALKQQPCVSRKKHVFSCSRAHGSW